MLRRLAEQTVPPRRVLVVDNGGTLSTGDLADLPLAGRTALIPRPDNPGYGAAVNLARADDPSEGSSALLVLTHDAMFDEHLAERLLSALREAPTSGAAAPVLYFASDPARVFSAGGRLTAGGRASHLRSVPRATPYPVDWADGAIVMYRRAALDAIDWLSEHYFLYFEDVDTAWRMSRAGWSTLIVPDAVARQQPGAHPMYLGVRNMTLFARSAGTPFLPHVFAVARRTAEEAVARLQRGDSPELFRAWRGWRDGRRGIGGRPGG